jgi:hypothetical protein
MVNEPTILRNHFRTKHPTLLESKDPQSSKVASAPKKRTASASTSSTAGADGSKRLWHCDTCDLDIPADANSVKDHNASNSHQTMHMLIADVSRPDGAGLAAAARQKNVADDAAKFTSKWITVKKKNGSVKKKLVKGPRSAAVHAADRPDPPANCTRDIFCLCEVCVIFGSLDSSVPNPKRSREQ